ncbi:MAG: endolytic transglycosylase MltG [Clostridia bacterium]|nr:endolytic transglycosylase MltG [Clostridia bacterium]
MGKKKRKKMIKKIVKLVFCLILIGAIATGAFYLIDIMNDIRGDEISTDEEILITIEKGDTATKLVQSLKDAGVIKYTTVFKLMARLESLETRLQVGTFTVSSGMSYDEIFNVFKTTQNYRKTVKITFIEGKGVGEIIDLLVENGVGSKDRYEQVIKGWDFGYDYLPEAGTENRLEGFLYPDTYEFFLDESEESVIKRFLDNFDKKAKASEIFTLLENTGRDFYKVMILASIIEEESQVDAEKARIASVFYNRLEINMKLQSDATVNYLLDVEDMRGSSTAESLAIDSPYNTYKYYGLPPTPVSNPTMSSIIAAINPEETTYYYFCSKNDGTGVHVFAETLEEHEKNVNEYLR